MKSHWITPYWDHYGLPAAFIMVTGLSLYTGERNVSLNAVWTVFRSLIFFYMLWRVIRQSQYAVEELRERDEARLTLLRSAEDYAKAQADAASVITDYTKRNAETMAHDIAKIREELIKNTELTIKAGDASAEAAHVANSMNEKIAQTHEAVLEKIEEVAKTSDVVPPLTSTEISLQHIDQQTAIIASNTSALTETPKKGKK